MSHWGRRTTGTKSTHLCNRKKKVSAGLVSKMTHDFEVIGPNHELSCLFMMCSKNLLELLNMANFIQSKYRNGHSTRSNTWILSGRSSSSIFCCITLWLNSFQVTKARNHRSRRRWDDRVGFLEVKVQRSRSWTWRGQLSTTLQSRTASHPASELSHMDKSQGAARSPSYLEKNTLLIITSPNRCVQLGVPDYSHKDLRLFQIK